MHMKTLKQWVQSILWITTRILLPAIGIGLILQVFLRMLAENQDISNQIFGVVFALFIGLVSVILFLLPYIIIGAIVIIAIYGLYTFIVSAVEEGTRRGNL